jgi:Mrp family chromosome partitioning ATPase
MSRNFEMLRQAGRAEELFPAGVLPAGSTEPIAPIPTVLEQGRREPSPARGPIQSSVATATLEAVAPEALTSSITEEELRLVQQVFLSPRLPRRQMVVFAGVERHADGAAISARAATILAGQGEGRVCLVDGDLRAPSLHRFFDIDGATGMADVLRDGGSPLDVARQVGQRLWLVPSGVRASEPRVLPVPDRLGQILADLRDQFDSVLVNGAPFGESPESILLGQLSDGVVLIVEAHATRRARARRVKERLDAAQVSVLGVVLNNRTFPIPDRVYRGL